MVKEKFENLLNTLGKSLFHKIDNLENTYKLKDIPVFVHLGEKGDLTLTKILDSGRKEILSLKDDVGEEEFAKSINFWDKDSTSNSEYVDIYSLFKDTIKNSNFTIEKVTVPDGVLSRFENIEASNGKSSSITFTRIENEYILGYRNSLGLEKNYSIDVNDMFAMEKMKNIFILESISDETEIYVGKGEYSLSDNLNDYPNLENVKLTKTNNGYLAENNEGAIKSFVSIESALFHLGAIDTDAYIQKIVDKTEETKLYIETSYLYKVFCDVKNWVEEKPTKLVEMLADLDKANKVLSAYDKLISLKSEKDNLIYSEKYSEFAANFIKIRESKLTSEEKIKNYIASLELPDEQKEKIESAYAEFVSEEKELANNYQVEKEKFISSEILGEGKTLEINEVVIDKNNKENFEINLIAVDSEGSKYVLTPLEKSGIIQISEERDLEGLHYKLTPEKIEVEGHEIVDTVIVRNYVDAETKKSDIEFASKTITVRQSDRTVKWSDEIEGFIKDAEKVYNELEVSEPESVVEEKEIKETTVIKETIAINEEDKGSTGNLASNEEEHLIKEKGGLLDNPPMTDEEIAEQLQILESYEEAEGFMDDNSYYDDIPE